MTFKGRRTIGIVLSLAAVAVIAAGVQLFAITLRNPAWLSGWVLVGMVGLLTVYNLRKKLAYPPLLPNAVWLQMHIYTGLAALVVFFLHTGLGLPSGWFESTLFTLFLLVSVSGLVGLFLSRVVPKQLTSRGQDVIYERIPQYRREVSEDAAALVRRAVKEHDATTLAEYYEHQLLDFFARPRHRLHHLLQSGRPLAKLRDGLRARRRYMSEAEQAEAEQMVALVEAKDDLDYHQTMQGALKFWLFVHVPATYAMLACAVLHVVLVYRY
jgi:hypothetical protein